MKGRGFTGKRRRPTPLLDLAPGSRVCRLPEPAPSIPTEDQPTYVDHLPEVTRDRKD